MALPRSCVALLVGLACLLEDTTCGQDPGAAELSLLLRDLSSPEFARREAASRALETLGPASREALADRREGLSLEARLRVDEAIARIDASAARKVGPLQPTLVTLHLEERPLGEIVDALLRAGGYRRGTIASPTPGADHVTWARRTTTFTVEGRPFFEALDLLGAAESITVRRDFRSGRFQVGAETPIPLPCRYVGPLKVALTTFSISRVSRFLGDPTTSAQLQLLVDLEEDAPVVGVLGPVRTTRVVDDRGADLSLPDVGSTRFLIAAGPRRQIHLAAMIAPPDRDAKMLRVLELELAVVKQSELAVTSIRDPDLRVRAPTNGAPPPEETHGSLSLALDGVQVIGEQLHVTVSFTPPRPEGDAPPNVVVSSEEIRVFDQAGHLLEPIAIHAGAVASGRQRRTILLGPGERPAEIEVRALARYEITPLTVCFEGVPIP